MTVINSNQKRAVQPVKVKSLDEWDKLTNLVVDLAVPLVGTAIAGPAGGVLAELGMSAKVAGITANVLGYAAAGAAGEATKGAVSGDPLDPDRISEGALYGGAMGGIGAGKLALKGKLLTQIRAEEALEKKTMEDKLKAIAPSMDPPKATGDALGDRAVLQNWEQRQIDMDAKRYGVRPGGLRGTRLPERVAELAGPPTRDILGSVEENRITPRSGRMTTDSGLLLDLPTRSGEGRGAAPSARMRNYLTATNEGEERLRNLTAAAGWRTTPEQPMGGEMARVDPRVAGPTTPSLDFGMTAEDFGVSEEDFLDAVSPEPLDMDAWGEKFWERLESQIMVSPPRQAPRP